MTRDRDIDRVLDTWLADGPLRVADRVIDDVVDRIARQPQRPAWRLRSWRSPTMSTPIRLVALAGALIAALFAGSVLFSAGGGKPVPTAPPPTDTPSPTPLPRALVDGTLVGGTYRLKPFDAAPRLSIDVTVPGGWKGFTKWALLGPDGTEAPGGVGLGFLMPAGLFDDPCHWDLAGDASLPQQGDVATGRTVDELVTGLASNTHYMTGPATDTVVGGYPGKRVDLQLPADVDFATCDNVTGATTGAYFVWGTAEADGSDLYAQGPGNRWHLSILDVAGTRIVIVVTDYAATPDADRAAAQAIVDSIVITP